MRCDTDSIGAVRTFCDSVSSASATNLKLLNAIEKTVGWLTALQKQAESEVVFADKFREIITSCAPVKAIDPDNSIHDIIVQAEARLGEVVAVLSRQRQSALDDPELCGEHEETVVSEYDQTIKAIKMLHDGMVELRWAIMEHDADLEGVADKAHSSVEELMKGLQS
jgi:hypothetical protein